MFGKSIPLFRILGFKVRLDLSWLVLAVLVSWSLAVGLFPNFYLDLSTTVYWLMGIAGALGLFASIVFHEFFHSLVARRFGLPMKGITLFIFGGVAEMDDEPPSPKAELLMAIAGPLSSIALGFLFLSATLPLSGSAAAEPVTGVLGYLAFINWILAAFNLIPAFPLDGGRVLRAALWHWKKDLRGATRIASRIGSWFGLILILIGVINFLIGNFIGGIWQVMIGMFLRTAADMSYRQVLYRRTLEGRTVASFMNQEPVTAPASITIRQLVDDYIYRYHFKMFPVNENGKLLGCINTVKIKEIPRDEWDSKTVRESMDYCVESNSVDPGTDAMKAFSVMGRTGKSRLMVIEKGELVGVITLKDIMGYLSTKMELEEAAALK